MINILIILIASYVLILTIHTYSTKDKDKQFKYNTDKIPAFLKSVYYHQKINT